MKEGNIMNSFSNLNNTDMILSNEELILKLKSGKLFNGLVLALCHNTDLLLEDISAKVLKILETEDLSDLVFGGLDLSNDIKTIEHFKSVLFTDGIVWRSYVDSDNEYSGILFGTGKFLSNFREYGFQLSGNVKGIGNCGSFYTHTFISINCTKVSNEAKVELLEAYTNSIREPEIVSNRKEISEFIKWFVTEFLSSNNTNLEESQLKYSKAILTRLVKTGEDLSILPSGFDWKLEQIKDDYQYFVSELEININEGQLYIGDNRILGQEATDLFLSIGRYDAQLITFLMAMIGNKGISVEFK